MDARVVADADYDDPDWEDRDEADRYDYDPDSNRDSNRDDGFGVGVAVGIAVGVGVGVQDVIVAAVFVVAPIAALSAADNPYSLYPSLYVSFTIRIGIVRRAVASNWRRHPRRTRRTHRHIAAVVVVTAVLVVIVTAVFVVVLDYRPDRIETALYSDDDVSSLGIGVGVGVGVGNAAHVRRGRCGCCCRSYCNRVPKQDPRVKQMQSKYGRLSCVRTCEANAKQIRPSVMRAHAQTNLHIHQIATSGSHKY